MTLVVASLAFIASLLVSVVIDDFGYETWRTARRGVPSMDAWRPIEAPITWSSGRHR